MFALGCFAVSLFPVLGFFDMQFLAVSRVSDHFEYLPLIAVMALGAAGLHSWLPGRVLRIAAAVLVVALSALTVQRARVWAGGETLWRDTLARNPAAWAAHNNLGCILAGQNKYGEAMEHFVAALKLNPENATAHCNLGRSLSLQGRFDEAEIQFQDALKIKPADAEIQESYALALAEHGNKGEALKHLREAVRLQPEIERRLQLAALLYETGRFREAAAEYRLVLARQPQRVEALNNLAWLLATCPDATARNGTEAVRFAEQACRLTHYKDARMLSSLAAAYAEASRFSDALAACTNAVALAAAAGDRRFSEINERLRQVYLAGRPYHEPLVDTNGAGSN